MSDTEPQTAPEEPQEAAALKPKSPRLPSLSSKKLDKLRAKDAKRGVVYISRIPPHLKPQKLRQMLEQYADIGRLYLAPEDPMLRKKRKQKGGNSGKNFTEGWVEFEDKTKAKEVVAMLNGQQMGGKRRSAYYYDLWCLKYLPKFKWDHLTEEVNYQKAVREQRLAAELSVAKRERDFYLGRVDQAKAVSAMEERKRKRSAAEGGDAQQQQQQQQGGQAPGPAAAAAAGQGGSGGGEGEGRAAKLAKQGQQAAEAGGGKVLRMYGQRRSKADPVTDAAAPQLSSGLLKLIAGKMQQQRSGGGGGGGGGGDV